MPSTKRTATGRRIGAKSASYEQSSIQYCTHFVARRYNLTIEAGSKRYFRAAMPLSLRPPTRLLPISLSYAPSPSLVVII